MEVTYRRSLHKSYMCIKEQEAVQEKYELRMLEHQKIPRLLPVQTAVVEGERSYLYDISGRQQIEDYLSGKKMDCGMLRKLLFSILELCSILPEYLLREDGICLESEFIYVNLEDGSLYFTYLPFQNKSLPEAFEHCMEQVLRRIDHQDKAATELGYQVYQMCTQENANLREMLETALDKVVYQSTDRGKVESEKEEIKYFQKKTEIQENPKEFQETEKIQKKEHSQKGIVAKVQEWFSEKSFQKSVAEVSSVKRLDEKNPSVGKGSGFPIKGLFDMFALLKKDEKENYIKENTKKEKKDIKRETSIKDIKPKSIKKKHFERKNIEQSDSVVFTFQEVVPKFSEEEDASICPTEILGVRRQEPMGKLVYQGIHGCRDILIEGEEFLLGKNRQQADGVIEAEGVSRIHARISRQGNVYYIEDLNSTNGTYLNEEPLEYHQKRELNRNDRIRFGMEEYMFS